MSSISATPLTRNNTLQAASQQVPPQALIQRSGTPSLQQQQQNLISKIEKSEQLLKDIDTIEIIPLLFDLLDSVRVGKIAPKDFENAAGRLRLRISKLNTLVGSIDGLDEPVEEKLAKIEQVNQKTAKKKELIAQFKQQISDKFDVSNSDDVEMQLE